MSCSTSRRACRARPAVAGSCSSTWSRADAAGVFDWPAHGPAQPATATAAAATTQIQTTPGARRVTLMGPCLRANRRTSLSCQLLGILTCAAEPSGLRPSGFPASCRVYSVSCLASRFSRRLASCLPRLWACTAAPWGLSPLGIPDILPGCICLSGCPYRPSCVQWYRSPGGSELQGSSLFARARSCWRRPSGPNAPAAGPGGAGHRVEPPR